MKSNKRRIFLFLSLALPTMAIVASGVGAVKFSMQEMGSILFGNPDETQHAIFWVIRVPRVLMGLLVGAVLGTAGAAMQGLFRNPLADPGLVGVTSGATLFAAFAIILGLGSLPGFFAESGIAFFAFLGALVVTILVYQMAGFGGAQSTNRLLLAGIAINAACFALVGLLLFISTERELRNFTFWTLGSIGAASWDNIMVIAPVALAAIVGLIFLAKRIDAMALGEKDAGLMGLNIQQTKILILLFTTISVGAVTAFTGTIGFISLVVPHILRMRIGAGHAALLPASALGGALLLLIADTLARTVAVPQELPLGVITSIIGVPVFIWIMLKQGGVNKQRLAL